MFSEDYDCGEALTSFDVEWGGGGGGEREEVMACKEKGIKQM